MITANSEQQTANSGQRTANSLNLADSKQRTANSKQLAAGNELRRRAESVIKDRSIDAETRAVIRYGLEINDPLLPELVRRVDAGETIFETIVVLKRPKLK